MSEFVYDDIYIRIDELAERERALRSELAEVRRQRAHLKSQCHYSFISERPEWLSELPEEFWYPSHIASKVISDLSPNLRNRNVPPDLIDWQKSSGLKEFIVNLGLTLGTAIVALQLFFFLF